MSMSISDLYHHLTECHMTNDEIYKELNDLYKKAKREGFELGRKEALKEIERSGFYNPPDQWGRVKG